MKSQGSSLEKKGPATVAVGAKVGDMNGKIQVDNLRYQVLLMPLFPSVPYKFNDGSILI